MNMLGGLDNPHIIHALAVHVPVAMAMLGVLLALMCAVTQMKNVPLRRLAIGWYAFMAVVSFATVLTGERTLDKIPSTVAVDVRDAIGLHETLAENVWVLAAITTLVAIFCGARRDTVRSTFTVLMVLASLVTAIWIGVAAWYGTTLVYRDGVGVPKPPAVVMQAPGMTASPEVAPNAPAIPESSAAPLQPPSETKPGQPPPPLSTNHERYIDRLSKMWNGLFGFLWPAR
ncbi:MAG: hypothetical protein NTU83_11535 [Candidatus Hydrogenedentes bacterium]|nr:hypothetical protein [Candidatus Hydrogenedentota bacterium]